MRSPLLIYSFLHRILLLEVITAMSLFQDFRNNFIPSSWSCAAKTSTLMQLYEQVRGYGEIFQDEIEEQFLSDSSSFKLLNDGLIVAAIYPRGTIAGENYIQRTDDRTTLRPRNLWEKTN